jgi:hypothetical protein
MKEILGSAWRAPRNAAIFAAVAAIATASGRCPEAAPLPSSVGQWSTVYTWPDLPIHLHLLPNGKVLSWADGNRPETSASQPGSVNAHVVDIPAGQPPGDSVSVLNSKTDIFCSGHAFLSDGRLFVTGGRSVGPAQGVPDVNIFDYRGNTWTTKADYSAEYARWYASALTLPNGEVLLLSGTIDDINDPNLLPQVWKTGQGGFRDLTSAKLKLQNYPKLHVAPNGKVFHVGPEKATRFLDTSGTGSWTAGPSRKFSSRKTGASVMYDDGKILIVGGGDPPTKTAEFIDLKAASLAWQYASSMTYARRHINATVLADGKVLVTGGTSKSGNDASGAVLAAEMWDPATGPTGSWTTLASMQVPRLYHSTAILLPDGRVLSAGGNKANKNAEIYSPPYLFKGARPTISAAPASVSYGQTFSVQTPDAEAINKVRLIRLSSVTHSTNMNQRAGTLSFTKVSGSLNVTIPSNPNASPPGDYMLFILNTEGVPSIAKIIAVGAGV